ncbi:MAG: MFS transporter [Deltaproteobacteria bacterium]|jgi:predicted MFS family arabinose efflux permease|nr:MFS transporter [Deltaproteobacteria bacterium]MBW2498457.1 MFS transporter [Deltaproteobacteria bacterium]
MQKADEVSDRPGPHAYYVLFMLFLVIATSLIDRNILGILLEDIKNDLQVSDTQIGLLTGPAFAVTNAIAGIPLARLADRVSRRAILAWGLAAWSVLTAIQGLTRTFPALLVTRIGVGIGEASTGPAAHSLISDYFPPDRRASAISLYTLGGHLGVWLAFLVGGWLSDLYSWRVALVAVGVPGIALSVLVGFSVREPARGEIEGRRDTGEAVPMMEVVRVLGRKPTFRHLTMALPLFVCASYVLAIWGPPFLIRVHGLTKTQIGLYFGLIVGLSGGVGSVLGGFLSDRLAHLDLRWYARLPALAALVAIPFCAGFLLWPDPWVAMIFLVPTVLLTAVSIAPLWAANQAIAPLRMRATAYAIIHLGISAIAGGLAPQIVGILNDQLAPRLGDEAIRYSLFLILFTNLWGAFHGLMAARRLPADLTHV